MELFTSRYISDVIVSEETICLIDTKYHKLYIDTHDTDVVKQFKNWFKNFFVKGKAMTPTIVNYEKRNNSDSDDGEVLYFIKKFFLNEQN